MLQVAGTTGLSPCARNSRRLCEKSARRYRTCARPASVRNGALLCENFNNIPSSVLSNVSVKNSCISYLLITGNSSDVIITDTWFACCQTLTVTTSSAGHVTNCGASATTTRVTVSRRLQAHTPSATTTPFLPLPPPTRSMNTGSRLQFIHSTIIKASTEKTPLS